MAYAYIAYYTNQKGINVLETDCVKIEMEDLSAAMNLVGAYPLTDEQGYNTKPYRFKVRNTCNVGVDYHVNLEVLDIENRMSSKNVAARVDENEKVVLTEEKKKAGTYEGEDGRAIERYTLYTSTLAPGESKSHSVRVWIDESAGNDAQNKSFYSKVVIEGIQNQIAHMTMSEYIMDQSKSEDRGIEVVEHEATEQTPVLTDYRYTGKDPNNYVYFGCNEECSEENLYRIIGVIPTQSTEDGEYENRVKLIKANYYTEEESGLLLETNENYPAPRGKGYQSNLNANNKWEESTLQSQVLNGVYYSSLGEYQNYIAPAKWYLGAPTYTSYENYTPNQFYTEERSNTSGKSGGVTSYINNIGLLYPSDYGYSIGSEYKAESIYINGSNYKNVAWLYNLENIYYEWTMTPESNYSITSAWSLNAAGRVGGSIVYDLNNIWGIRPTFYLKASVMYGGGKGTSEDPYRIIENRNKFSNYIIAASAKDASIEKIEHEETEQTPALTDYRYTGKNPDNYVCFGYEGERCPDNNLYRIIGVIPTQSSETGSYENRVKLIKASNYEGPNVQTASYSDVQYTPSGKGYKWNTIDNNKWEESSLKNELNTEYWNSLGEYQNYIGLSKWYLGAPDYNNVNIDKPENFYQDERSNITGISQGKITYINNIGLMYLSDYGYSIEKEYWFKDSIMNQNINYQEKAWLYNSDGQKYHEWTISPEAKISNNTSLSAAWCIHPSGFGRYNFVSYSVYLFGARPTFYLKASVLYKKGEGTIDNPYYISL